MSTRESEIAEDEPSPTASEMLRMLAGNKPFWIVSAAMLFGAFSGTFFQKTLPYYFKYLLQREDLIGLALTMLTGAVMLSIPVWTWVMKHSSTRVMWLCGAAIGLTGYTLLWILPAQPNAVLPTLLLLGFGSGAAYIGFWAMMPDTVEFGEWMSGIRAEGAIFGVVSFIQKAGLGLAAAVLGETLAVVGYRANIPQTPETLASMRVIMIAIPAVLAVAAACVIAFYRLDHKKHSRLVRALAWRREKLMHTPRQDGG